jgi:hypothetical protein
MGDMAGGLDNPQETKAQRHAATVAALLAAGVDVYTEPSKSVFRFERPAGAVMFYSATKCWQYRGKTGRGDVHAFVKWFKAQSFARPE